MSEKFTCKPEQVTTFAHKCEDKHTELVTAIRNLKTYEDNLTQTWNGQAKLAFDSFMERYYYQADRVNDKLLETIQNLIKISGQFADADAQFKQQVSSHTGALDLPAL